MIKETPKHIVAVSAFVLNKIGETLLVKTHNRLDTWEPPGGQVELGEPLDIAVCREVFEETGFIITPIGITGVYYHATKQILSVVFRAKLIGGELTLQAEEIRQARFTKLNSENIDEYITRPHMKSRTLDAMKAEHFIPYETWETNPHHLLGRIDGDH
ncbi:NUDIX hydrolase [Falsibacillus albus]|uniref:NUDIX hydrolase n=1 Tax=Falsibacillus albus TaxID=2478915 RepID=A0A3L7JVC2_9BACI|nr:NUDIX hydrolase [Falsibacillus albus]RLQ94255.1 NUDIX hydrolase [Falsibacillus albus]